MARSIHVQTEYFSVRFRSQRRANGRKHPDDQVVVVSASLRDEYLQYNPLNPSRIEFVINCNMAMDSSVRLTRIGWQRGVGNDFYGQLTFMGISPNSHSATVTNTFMIALPPKGLLTTELAEAIEQVDDEGAFNIGSKSFKTSDIYAQIQELLRSSGIETADDGDLIAATQPTFGKKSNLANSAGRLYCCCVRGPIALSQSKEAIGNQLATIFAEEQLDRPMIAKVCDTVTHYDVLQIADVIDPRWRASYSLAGMEITRKLRPKQQIDKSGTSNISEMPHVSKDNYLQLQPQFLNVGSEAAAKSMTVDVAPALVPLVIDFPPEQGPALCIRISGLPVTTYGAKFATFRLLMPLHPNASPVGTVHLHFGNRDMTALTYRLGRTKSSHLPLHFDSFGYFTLPPEHSIEHAISKTLNDRATNGVLYFDETEVMYYPRADQCEDCEPITSEMLEWDLQEVLRKISRFFIDSGLDHTPTGSVLETRIVHEHSEIPCNIVVLRSDQAHFEVGEMNPAKIISWAEQGGGTHLVQALPRGVDPEVIRRLFVEQFSWTGTFPALYRDL
jgi:hypothetical protein